MFSFGEYCLGDTMDTDPWTTYVLLAVVTVSVTWRQKHLHGQGEHDCFEGNQGLRAVQSHISIYT